jgi:ribosomal protein S18 acetylase RimI-like enzyme
MAQSDDPRHKATDAPADLSQWPRISAHNLAHLWEYPAQAPGQRRMRWEDVWAADAGSACAYLNSATLQRPITDQQTADLVQRLEAFYAGGTGGPWLLWSAWPTPDLQAHGMSLVGHPPLMVRLSGDSAVPFSPDLRIVEVGDDAQLRDFERVFVDAYPIPELQPYGAQRIFDSRILGAPFHAWVGYVDASPVAVAATYVGEHAVGVYMVATLPQFRGRGYGAALTLRAAQADATLPAELQASDDGQPVYLRLGFQVVAHYALWMALRK